MFTKNTTVILPAAGSGWEVWRCNGSSSVWKGSATDPVKGVEGAGSVIVALPARSCRTFAFSAPTEDRQLLRKLTFAQLEKRGLTNVAAEQTPFECHVVRQGDGQSLVSVDVITPEATTTATAPNARALIASARLFPLPEGKLIIVEEQGRLVLCAGVDGRTLHTQIISNTSALNGHGADEIRMAGLALRQQGIVSEINGLELWGDFPPDEAASLGEQLGIPVEIKARPAPDGPTLRREASVRLLPAKSRLASRRRRLGSLRWLAAAAVALPLLWWAYGKHRELRALEAEAARIEATLDIPGEKAASADQDRVRAEHELVNAAQARWSALRLALEPRRYPVAHLDGLSRCLTAADVVLTRFESKVADVTIAGTARSAMDAYNYFNTVSQDGPLGVYGWSMLQPSISADGSASFEIKGKMR